MIEVNLYSIPAQDSNARVGRCVARNRFDKEAMGVSVENFVKGFLKDNLDRFETSLGNADLVNLINSDSNFGKKDLACINYYLTNIGFRVDVYNVADDEENSTGVPDGDVVEWNIIDRNFIQEGYPTVTKIVPGDGTDVIGTLHQVVDSANLFGDKFAGMKNPFSELFISIDRIKGVTGAVNATLVSRVYETLDTLGIDVFCATSEN